MATSPFRPSFVEPRSLSSTVEAFREIYALVSLLI